YTWKHRLLGSNLIKGKLFYSKQNPIYMRLGEVLFLGAEASLKSGDKSSALKYVNKIRRRAKLGPLGGVTMEDIKKGKRLELWNEATRYLDLQRWGDAYKFLKNQGAKIPTFYGLNED